MKLTPKEKEAAAVFARIGGLARGRLPKATLTRLGRNAVNARWAKVKQANKIAA